MKLLKKLKPTRSQLIAGTIIATSLGLSYAAAVGIPNTFTAGTSAAAADVNANFTAVETAINSNATAINTNTTNIGNSSKSASTFSTNTGPILTSTASEIISLSFTCPADGFVLAHGQVTAKFDHGVVQQNLFIKLSTTIETLYTSGTGWIQINLPDTFPAMYGYRLPVSVSDRFSCVAGVPVTYRLNASEPTSSNGVNTFRPGLVLSYSAQ